MRDGGGLRFVGHLVGSIVLGAVFVLSLNGGAARAEAPPKERIHFLDAQKKALAAFPGKVKSGSLEKIAGKWVYVFEISGKKKVHLLSVDAKSGELIKNEISQAR